MKPSITAKLAQLSERLLEVNQLLSTARTDTIADYTPAKYGMGEASLANALSPSSLQ